MAFYFVTTDNHSHSCSIITTIITSLVTAAVFLFSPINSAVSAQCYTELIPPDASEYDNFGHAVAISANLVAVVGSPYDDENGIDSGSVYIYRFDADGSGQWVFEQKLVAARGEPGDIFGYSVAIAKNADVVIIGACKDNDTDDDAGAAYTYKYNPENSLWELQNKILAEDGSTNDYFGCSVSISEDGNTVIIGACRDDYKKHASGSAYIFQYHEDKHLWKQKIRLNAFDLNSYDYFGYAVSISQDTAIIGAYGDDDNGQWSGSAYIYRYDDIEDKWLIDNKIMADDGATDDWFGASVSISGNIAVVGASYHDNVNGYNAGSAYLYVYDEINMQWYQERQLLAKHGSQYDQFGFSVAISNNLIIVGTPTGENENNSNGSAFIYKYPGPGKQLIQNKILAPNNDNELEDSWFGFTVAITDAYAIIGARFDDDNGKRSGSTHMYNLSPPCKTITGSVGR